MLLDQRLRTVLVLKTLVEEAEAGTQGLLRQARLVLHLARRDVAVATVGRAAGRRRRRCPRVAHATPRRLAPLDVLVQNEVRAVVQRDAVQ